GPDGLIVIPAPARRFAIQITRITLRVIVFSELRTGLSGVSDLRPTIRSPHGFPRARKSGSSRFDSMAHPLPQSPSEQSNERIRSQARAADRTRAEQEDTMKRKLWTLPALLVLMGA